MSASDTLALQFRLPNVANISFQGGHSKKNFPMKNLGSKVFANARLEN
jgi:hypothetical protein